MDGSLQIDLEKSHVSDDDASATSVPRKLTVSAAAKVGVVILDADGVADSGWACVNGEPPYRVKSPFGLSSDVIWWSNLSQENIIGRAPQHVRHTKFLKVGMHQALAELGLGDARPEEAVEHLAFHFAIIIRILEKLSGKSYSMLPQSKYFHHDLMAVAGPAPALDDYSANRFRHKVARNWTQIELANNANTICFRVPRLSYALKLLDTNIPLKAVTWRQSPMADPMETIRSSLAPVYAEYFVRKAVAKPAQIFGLANDGSNRPALGRSISGHGELLALGSFADLKVSNIWKGDAYHPAHDTMPPSLMTFLRSKSAIFSWSAGVIAQSLIQGLCAFKPVLNYRAIWMSEADKIAMFTTALSFSKTGYRPTSYGQGWIKVMRPETARGNAGLLSVALRLGLLPDPDAFDPSIIADVAAGTYGEPRPENGWGVGAFAARHFLLNRYDEARMADDMPLLSPAALERRQSELRKLLQSA